MIRKDSFQKEGGMVNENNGNRNSQKEGRGKRQTEIEEFDSIGS